MKLETIMNMSSRLLLTSSCSFLPQLPLAGSRPPQAQIADFCFSSVTVEWKFAISPTPPKETQPKINNS